MNEPERISGKSGYLWITLILGLPAITILPSLLGLFRGGAYFSGCLENIHDQNIYFSFISQAKDGFLFFINAPCSIVHEREYANFTFLAIGWFSRISGLSMEFSYVLFSYLFGVSVCFCLAGLFLGLIKDQIAAAAGLCAAWMGAGFGVIYKIAFMAQGLSIDKVNMTSVSGDLWMPEMTIWHSAIYSPLFISSYLMIILIYGGIWLAEKREGILPLAVSAAAVFFLALSHSYDIVPVGMISFALMVMFRIEKKVLWKPRVFAGYMLFAAGLLAGTAYQYYVLKHNPGFSIWADQNVNKSPPFHIILAGFGFLSLGFIELALLMAFERKKMDLAFRFLGFWLVFQTLLLYSPFPFSRRFILGIIIPLSFFFILFLMRLWKKSPASRIIAVALFIGTFPTFIYQEAANAGKALSRDQRYFFIGDRISAYRAMSPLGFRDVIMGSLEESNCLLRFTRAQMACASQQQSSPGAKEALGKILDGDSSGLEEFIRKNRITYIFLDRKAQAVFISANRAFLSSQNVFYENDGYIVYKVYGYENEK
jgi:hypothetical protein